MHFSSPSGQRLSWCLPWKRGAVGFFSNGYCSVTTFLNIVRNVTPKPATGSTNCSLKLATDGLPFSGCLDRLRVHGQQLRSLLAGHRGHRIATGECVEL